MRGLRRRGQLNAPQPHDLTGSDAYYDSLVEQAVAETAEWAVWLVPYINQALQMVRAGTPGEVRTRRHNRVTYGVSASSRYAAIHFVGYAGAARVEGHLRGHYHPLGFVVTGNPDTRSRTAYHIFVGPQGC